MNNIDISGRTFGRLTVLSFAGRGRWHVRCACGTEKTVKRGNLGRTVSCGCKRREDAANGYRTHGLTGSREFSSWGAMKARCSNSSLDAFRNYGGRGIRVCERWLKFENFLADMGSRPPGTSLDRINNDGDYEPGNCRWATRIEQSRNRSVTAKLTFKGETLPMIEWAERLSINYDILRGRIRAGWSVERALTQPIRKLPCKSEPAERAKP